MNLGQILTSEYTGIMGAANEQEVVAAVEQGGREALTQVVRQAKRTAKQVTNNGQGSRAEFEKRIHLLPKDIQGALASQSMQFVDTFFYVTKDVSQAKVVKMFRDDDNKVVGECNISSAKFEKGNYFLLHEIQLLYGVADAGETKPFKVNFNTLPDYIRNGEFELKAQGTVLIPATSLEMFYTEGKNVVKGCYQLSNPKIIRDQHTIELNLEWGANAPDRAWVKAILRGTSVVKA